MRRVSVYKLTALMSTGASLYTQNWRLRGSPNQDRPVNALQLCRWKFTHKETFHTRLSSKEIHSYTENNHFSLMIPSP